MEIKINGNLILINEKTLKEKNMYLKNLLKIFAEYKLVVSVDGNELLNDKIDEMNFNDYESSQLSIDITEKFGKNLNFIKYQISQIDNVIIKTTESIDKFYLNSSQTIWNELVDLLGELNEFFDVFFIVKNSQEFSNSKKVNFNLIDKEINNINLSFNSLVSGIKNQDSVFVADILGEEVRNCMYTLKRYFDELSEGGGYVSQ